MPSDSQCCVFEKVVNCTSYNQPNQIKMKLSLLCTIVGLISCISLLHSQSLEWARSLNGIDGSVSGLAMKSTIGGDLIVSGTYTGICDFDPGPDTHFLPDLSGGNGFIARYDSLGNLIWAKAFNLGNVLSVLETDVQGNIYLTGSFQNTVDFDPGPNELLLTSNAFRDIFVMKLNSAGELVWVQQFGSVEQNSGHCLAADQEGNVYASGIFRGSVDFDPGPDTLLLTAEGEHDMFILKFNPEGDLMWGQNMDWLSTATSYAMDVHSDGNVFIGGPFYDSIHFEVNDTMLTLSAPESSNANSFVSRMNPDGEFLWAAQLGVTSSVVIKDLKLDSDGNILTTGVFWDTPDFDPGPETFFMSSDSSSGTFITKLDFGGNFIWARSFVGTHVVNPEAITIDAEGSVYTTGIFGEVADFDPDGGGYFINGDPIFFDAYIAKLRSTGDFVWARSISSPEAALGKGVAVLPSGKVALLGTYQNQTDVAPSPETYFFNTNQMFATNTYLVCWNQECKATLNGKSFLDLNGNMIQDDNEPAFANAIYSSTFTTGLFHGASDGTFSVCVPPNDSVEIALINAPEYFEAIPENYVSNVGAGDFITGLDFALVPENEGVFDLEIDLWSVFPDVSGFSTTYYLSFNNVGSMCIDNANIKVVLDDDLTLVSLSGAEEYTFESDTITIAMDSICPFAGGEIQMEVLLSEGVPFGEELASHAILFPVSGDANQSNNNSTLLSTALAAYDPNDKAVNKDTIYPGFMEDEKYLEYLIRFQNTGNYFAQNVWVDDVLSPLLDQSSFQLLSASHDVEVEFHDNEVRFVFDNIMLPDSTSNEPESHGFIRFKIKPENTLSVGETIENTAAIFFDFNDPIITNTTQTLYTLPVGIGETRSHSIRAFPNPTRDVLHVHWGQLQPKSCHVADVSGRVVKTIHLEGLSEYCEFNVGELTPGMYFLNLNTDNRQHVLRWIKQ